AHRDRARGPRRREDPRADRPPRGPVRLPQDRRAVARGGRLPGSREVPARVSARPTATAWTSCQPAESRTCVPRVPLDCALPPAVHVRKPVDDGTDVLVAVEEQAGGVPAAVEEGFTRGGGQANGDVLLAGRDREALEVQR